MLFIVRYLAYMCLDAGIFDVCAYNHTQMLVNILKGIWGVRD